MSKTVSLMRPQQFIDLEVRAHVCTSKVTRILSKPVEIASALTAELQAIEMSLNFLIVTLMPQRQMTANVCSIVECIVWIPTTNTELCCCIHAFLAPLHAVGHRIKLLWSPGYEGIPETRLPMCSLTRV